MSPVEVEDVPCGGRDVPFESICKYIYKISMLSMDHAHFFSQHIFTLKSIIESYGSNSYIGFVPYHEIIKKTRSAYNSRTEKRILLSIHNGKTIIFMFCSSRQTVYFKRTKMLVVLVPSPKFLLRQFF